VQEDGFKRDFRYILVNCRHPESCCKGVGIPVGIQELGPDVGFIDSCVSDHLLLAHPCMGLFVCNCSSNEV